METNEERIRRLGISIAQLRTEQGLSQIALARMIGYTDHAELSRFENGHKPPSIPKLYDIADALDVDISYFFTKF